MPKPQGVAHVKPCPPRSNGLFGLGVADGVYMWAKLGIDSGVFSRALMDTARRTVEAGTADVLNGASNACPSTLARKLL